MPDLVGVDTSRQKLNGPLDHAVRTAYENIGAFAARITRCHFGQHSADAIKIWLV
jgi:hypothetical protein